MVNLPRHQKRKPGQLADAKMLKQVTVENTRVSCGEIRAIFEKHKLEPIQDISIKKASIHNLIYEIKLRSEEVIILKVEMRPRDGSIITEPYVIQTLRDAGLPVSNWCILDEDRDIIPYSLLLVNKLPGELGNVLFECINHRSRISLFRQLGKIVGICHGVKVNDSHSLVDDDLGHWKRILKSIFLDDLSFEREIASISDEFLPYLERILSMAKIPMPARNSVLLWRDAGVFNLCADPDSMTVTGVFDFQDAGFGSPLADFMRFERFVTVNHMATYNDQAFIDSFYAGYEIERGTVPTFDEHSRTIIDAITTARKARRWWDWCGILHPNVPGWLNDISGRLKRYC